MLKQYRITFPGFSREAFISAGSPRVAISRAMLSLRYPAGERTHTSTDYQLKKGARMTVQIERSK